MPADIHAQIVSIVTEIFRLCVWLLLLWAIFTPIEWFIGASPRPAERKEFWTDVGYYFLNNLFTSALQIPFVVVLGWALHFLVPAHFYDYVGTLPLWLRLAVGFFIGDAGYYWAHRMMHEKPFLWRFHSIHHSAPQMYWLVSTKAHPLDIIFGHLGGLIPLYALGLSQPFAGRSDVVAQLFIIITMMWSFFIHSNVNWRLGWAKYLVSTPAFHHWHHTKRDHINRNYSALLPCLDMVFSTYHLPKELPSEYGIPDPMPSDIKGQLLAPFSDR